MTTVKDDDVRREGAGGDSVMRRTVFITGASSGIGRQTALLFQERGWNVIATMRDPRSEEELGQLDKVLVTRCDVTDPDSIRTAIDDGLSAFGSIDVLVNNAGYYLLGPLEAMTYEQIRRQIDTNLVGVILVTMAMVPHFRERRAGTIINLSSIAGVVSIPLQSLYHATKFGVEGFSEALRYELRPFGIQVKLIEPGVIMTEFLGRSMAVAHNDALTDYAPYVETVTSNIFENGEKGSPPRAVAETIYRASIEGSRKLRYPVGHLSQLVALRKALPYRLFEKIMSFSMEKQR